MEREDKIRLIRATRQARRRYLCRADSAGEEVRLLTWSILMLLRGTGYIDEQTTQKIERPAHRLYYNEEDAETVCELRHILHFLGMRCFIPRAWGK